MNLNLNLKNQIRKEIEKIGRKNDLIHEEKAAKDTKSKDPAKGPIENTNPRRLRKKKTATKRRAEAEANKDKSNEKERGTAHIVQKTETEKRNTDDQPDSL